MNMLDNNIYDNKYDEKLVRLHYKELTEKLIEANLSITTMESATSGQIASLITDTEGASAILKGAFITYSNEAKVMQGVSEELIEEYSVYSEEVAYDMAKTCREKYRADIGIGVTGTMGNVDPMNEAFSTPGQVYFAISMNRCTEAYYLEIPKQPTRLAYKLAVAEEIYKVLYELIK